LTLRKKGPSQSKKKNSKLKIIPTICKCEALRAYGNNRYEANNQRQDERRGMHSAGIQVDRLQTLNNATATLTAP
jgi:hypothetical protein